jgi:hypothetical protein
MRDDTLRRDLERLLQGSAALPSFRDAVRAFADDARVSTIELVNVVPRLKVLRLVAQLLDAERDVPIAAIRVDARSGCADFRGAIHVRDASGGELGWRFTWDCRWRAEQEGMFDRWGQPDQMRAAREFGWRCFARWERLDPTPRAPSLVEERA